MDSLDWEVTQLCRKMERTEARRKAQQFQVFSPEEHVQRDIRNLENGYLRNKRELERTNPIPLERLNERELEKAVNMILNMALLDIVGTEGARGLLRMRKYCADDLILERLLEAFEQMFVEDKTDDAGKRRRDFMEEDLG
jgi:hypothetical protein